MKQPRAKGFALKWVANLLTDTHAQIEADRDHNEKASKPWIILATSLSSLVFFHYVFMNSGLHWQLSQTLVDGRQTGIVEGQATRQDLIGLSEVLIWAFGSIVSYLLLPALIVRFVLKEQLADYGLQVAPMRPYFRVYLAILIPTVFIVGCVSFIPEFQETYPLFAPQNSWELLLIWELVYGFQFLALEFFYRGFMLHGLKGAFGMGSLWIMIFPYVMIHFAKPWPETIGAIFAGLALGLLSLRTKTIMGGVVLHILIAWWADLLGIWHRGLLP